MSKLSLLPLIERLKIWGGPEIMSECIVELGRNADTIDHLDEEIERLTAANKNLGKQLQDVEMALNTQSAEVQRLKAAERMSLEQADDPGLWFNAQYAAEDYLQTALRSLHAVIEGDPCPVSGRECQHPVHSNPGLAVPCPEYGADDSNQDHIAEGNKALEEVGIAPTDEIPVSTNVGSSGDSRHVPPKPECPPNIIVKDGEFHK